jgi:hypothetical protein
MNATITPDTQTDAQSDPQTPLTAHESRADQTGRADPVPQQQQPASEGHGDDAAPPRPPQPPTQHGRGGRGGRYRPLPSWARILIYLIMSLLAFGAGWMIGRSTKSLIRYLEHPRG